MIFIIIILLVLIACISRITSLVILIRTVEKKQWKNCLQIALNYIQKRSERRLLIYFISSEVTLAGFPFIANVTISFVNDAMNLKIETSFVDDRLDIFSFLIAIIIAGAYFFYLFCKDRKNLRLKEHILNASNLINDELNFAPTCDWFRKQNEIAINSLDKRYNREINFPFEDMSFALASMQVEDAFKPLLNDDIAHFVDKVKRFWRRMDKESNDVSLLEQKCKHLINEIRACDDSVEHYTLLANLAGGFYSFLDNYNFSNKHYFPEYDLRELRRATSRLCDILSNQWIELKAKRTLFITGEAGCGKSHLIGDMVTRRCDNGDPSILFLGQHFINAEPPLEQMRKKLDINCKKKQMLQKLNDYGAAHNKNVVIFIDAINEGAGEAFWRNFLTDFISEIERFEYLRLIISFRLSDRKNWFNEMAHDSNYGVYKHKGFKGNEREACNFLFESFGLDQPLWPVYGNEFANPLFLIKYCRSHEKSGQPLLLEDFWTTLCNYCLEINRMLAIRLNYNEALNLVLKSMRSVAQLMVEGGDRWNLEYSTVIKKLENDAKYTFMPEQFLDSLLDEGLLRTEHFGNKVSVNFGFERIGDYFIAEYLIEQNLVSEWNNPKWGNLEEACTIIVPKIWGKEAFEKSNDSNLDGLIEAFVENSAWRDNFCDKGHELITKWKKEEEYNDVFNIILSRPFRNDHCANGSTLYELLWNMTMPQRDELWSMKIADKWGLGQKIMNLAKWACNASDRALYALSKENALRCAETLIWTFSVTWLQLRDIATHALVNILRTHDSLIELLLNKYYKVNDPYIEERLWCAVYGAALLIPDRQVAINIGKWTYETIFESFCVPNHVLIRDYAKNIVNYAQYCGSNLFIDETLINLPFSDGEIPDVLSSEEIEMKYNRKWNDIPEDEKNEYIAIKTILSSMYTEYAPTEMYGDFGRYVFQAYLDDFGEDVDKLSRWAIMMIFDEFGYDAQAFSWFDCHLKITDNNTNKVERIGKKYQWIALYKIMAVLMDKYPYKDWREKCSDPICNARNIDPTICKRYQCNKIKSFYQTPSYSLIKPADDIKWMKTWKRMPAINAYLLSKDCKGREWLTLFAYNTIKQTNLNLDEVGMNRDLWTFVQAYAVNKKHLKKVLKKIDKFGIRGRDFHENNEIYDVFNREFYWSDAYKRVALDKYYKHVPLEIAYQRFDEIVLEPTYLQYLLESVNDASSENSYGMYMPNEWIYKGLNLSFSDKNGAWTDINGEVVAFDNSVYADGKAAFLIRKDILLKYLNDTNRILFWPVLNERSIVMDNLNYANHEQNGGYAYMDNKGRIFYHFKSYEPSYLEKLQKCWNKNFEKKEKKCLLWLHNHHFIKLPFEKVVKFNYDDDNPN